MNDLQTRALVLLLRACARILDVGLEECKEMRTLADEIEASLAAKSDPPWEDT